MLENQLKQIFHWEYTTNIIRNSRLNTNYSKKESNAKKKTELKNQKRESQIYFIPKFTCSGNWNSVVCEKDVLQVN